MSKSYGMVMEKSQFHVLVSDALELCKVRLSLFIGLSALCGYMLYKPVLNGETFFSAWAVFFLSCGCSTLNNVQDRKRDAASERTRYRALADRRISPRYALFQAAVFIAVGLLLAGHVSNSLIPVWLGVLSVFLYNGIYTPLKSLCLISLAPGILCGMIPPLIGWAMAGGGMPDLKMISLMFVFGLWQLPRLGLLNLSHLCEYSLKETRGIWGSISEKSLKRMVVFWVAGLSFMLILLVYQNVLVSSGSRFLVVFHSVCLCFIFHMGLKKSTQSSYKNLFVHLNASLLWVMILIVCERLVLFS